MQGGPEIFPSLIPKNGFVAVTITLTEGISLSKNIIVKETKIFYRRFKNDIFFVKDCFSSINTQKMSK